MEHINTNNLIVQSADYTDIKADLIDFMSNQSVFQDYNFEGSGLNTLISLLAYNTHYNATHSNLTFSEAFLDSAQIRSSVVSRAKEFGYTPRSMTASKAVIDVTFTVANSPDSYIIPKNTKFTATNTDGSTFYFVTTHDCQVDRNPNDTYTKRIEVIQGSFVNYSYIAQGNDTSQKFVVPARNVDTSTLTVRVKNTQASSSSTTFFNFKDYNFNEILPDSPVYFIQENFEGFYEIQFGDDVIGKSIVNNNEVQLEYLITSGRDGNGIGTMSLASSLPNVGSFSLSVFSRASGGGDRESKDSIKKLAPLFYASQNRAVNSNDYTVLVKKQFADIDDVSVWGGEDNDPPFYGKVFMAVKPKDTNTFTNTRKETIQSNLQRNFGIVAIRPEIVDPDYTFVSVNTVVTYDTKNRSTSAQNTLTQDIKTAIQNYFDSQVNRFGQSLYYSGLVKAIDNSNSMILNSVTNLKLEKTNEITPNISNRYEFNFNNAIHPGSVRSNDFVVNGLIWSIKDRPGGAGPHNVGTIEVFRTNSQGKRIFLTRQGGTIDYNSGKIVIENIVIQSIVGDPRFRLLTVMVSPGSFANMDSPETVYTDYNVYTNGRDQIISLKSDDAITIKINTGRQ